ncbi:UDP-N-acetylmuramoyl-L-alanine--D-glutamate ligase [Bacillus ndiopicus]|uniref:UDP-N-acetylmuramoyl-L-alanine--D-glutamate ligase n=1 Tax=Bacillus ndiopicus TaxID=1347368 RepID=UPI0005AA1BAE|nr:UDP-N-acetylmuramoyl-L-alanine--D-glutamate ligase [Bacillus ndiopicus]
MIQYTGLQYKKVLVLGLAKSGVAAAELLHELGAFVTVNDARPFDANPEAQSLLAKGITVICGRHPEDLLDEGFELIVKNPGIPYSNPIVADAINRQLPVITEMELAYLVSEAPFIGITGSNGKTTTTTLLFKILEHGQKQPLIAGNIGTVACSVAAEATKEQVLVTELSSFQLMGTRTFKPRIAILTNIYEAHLDYHSSFEEYADAKFAVTRNQDQQDYFIYNADQPLVQQYATKSKAQKIPFTTTGKTAEGISADAVAIYWKGEHLLDRSSIVLPGEHNLQNILCAVAAALLMECSVDAIKDILATFTGVKHRTQFVRNWKGVQIYNDSKATNCLATKSALAAFTQPIVLLAGGLDRGHSFEELREVMGNVKAVVAFGETGARFIDFAKSCGIEQTIAATNVEDAVMYAAKLVTAGDVMLLSPACASWDQYASFEIRGDLFIDAVIKLT